MDRNFYIFSDMDSTFDGSIEGFEKFNNAVQKLEQEVGKVKIYFASGTNCFDFQQRMDWLEQNAPEVFDRVEGAVLSEGYIRRDDIKPIQIKSAYKNQIKVRACDYLLSIIGFRNISGIIYMGDDKEDIKGMNFLKNFDQYFPYGVHTIMPANSKFDRMQKSVNYLAHSRKIEGCAEGILRVADKIEENFADFNY